MKVMVTKENDKLNGFEPVKICDFTVVFMPDGRPCPGVLTAEKTVQFLRLDNGDPMRTLKYFRDEGLLTGFRLGRRVRYRLEDVLSFVAKKSRGKADN